MAFDLAFAGKLSRQSNLRVSLKLAVGDRSITSAPAVATGTETALLSIACDCSAQREALAELRAGLRQRLATTPLFDGARFVSGVRGGVAGGGDSKPSLKSLSRPNSA